MSIEAKKKLIRLLQDAHAGERAAYFAYEGHWKSVSSLQEKTEIQKIQKEEMEHRACLSAMLGSLDSGPRYFRELKIAAIGRAIGLLCRLGGWFIPMYGAGKLEQGNIVEYEVAALLAIESGHPELALPLIAMAEVEWDHELYFRKKTSSHWAAAYVPLWPAPPPREAIRQNFEIQKSALLS